MIIKRAALASILASAADREAPAQRVAGDLITLSGNPNVHTWTVLPLLFFFYAAKGRPKGVTVDISIL